MSLQYNMYSHCFISFCMLAMCICISYMYNILDGKYSLESTDPRESEIRAPPQPLPYLMPIPPTRFL